MKTTSRGQVTTPLDMRNKLGLLPNPVDTERLVGAFRARLKSEPDVVVAYLFGSTARGTAGPLSDIDVAFLLDPEADLWERRLDLIGAVAEIFGDDRCDVAILNDAPIDLAYRVVRDGIVLICNDNVARVDHWVRTLDRYFDMEPFRRTISRGLSNRIREGKFGRP